MMHNQQSLRTSASIDGANLSTDWSTDKIIRSGMITILVSIMVFFLWAFTAELSRGVIATGSFVVNGDRKIVQHLEGGIVKDLLVEEGSVVKAGDPLIELDPTQSVSQNDILRTRYYTNLAITDRLKAELGNAGEIAYSPEIAANADQEMIKPIIANQSQIFAARKEQLLGELDILRQRQSQLEQQIIGLRTQKQAAENEFGIIEQEHQKALSLKEKGLLAITAVWDLEKELNRLRGGIGKITSEIATTDVAIGEAKLQELQVLKTMREKVSEELQEVQKELYTQKEQLIAIGDIVERTIIRAPQNGVVLGLNYVTIGGVVEPAKPIMEIVPTDDQLMVEVKVRAVDVDAISINMPARVKLSGFNQRVTPELDGVITRIAADAIVDEQTGESFYTVRLSLSEGNIDQITTLKIVPGMPVEVLINAGSRTPIEYFMEPISQVLRRSMTEG